MDTLVNSEEDVKSIILSEEPTTNPIFYQFGSGNFVYNLTSDINNFDPLLMANSLIDLIITCGYDRLLKEHMEIFMICTGKNPDATINRTDMADVWLKFFQKFKDFLIVSICDDLLIEEALMILHNFLTSPSLKHQIYQECHEQLCRSLELLYDGNAQVCKDKFREYLLNAVVDRTEDTDNALKKFFKSLL
jgi:hypothetical protein